MRTLPLVLFLGCGRLFQSACAAAAEPGDSITASTGGLGPGHYVNIDLNDGRVVSTYTAWNGIKPSNPGRNGRLKHADLDALKALARASVAAGFETPECTREDAQALEEHQNPALLRPPPSDAGGIFFNIQIEGRIAGAPPNQCETDAFRKLLEATMKAADSSMLLPADGGL